MEKGYYGKNNTASKWIPDHSPSYSKEKNSMAETQDHLKEFVNQFIKKHQDFIVERLEGWTVKITDGVITIDINGRKVNVITSTKLNNRNSELEIKQRFNKSEYVNEVLEWVEKSVKLLKNIKSIDEL